MTSCFFGSQYSLGLCSNEISNLIGIAAIDAIIAGSSIKMKKINASGFRASVKKILPLLLTNGVITCYKGDLLDSQPFLINTISISSSTSQNRFCSLVNSHESGKSIKLLC